MQLLIHTNGRVTMVDAGRVPPSDQDGGWKQLVDTLFAEFLRFFFPDVYAAIDLDRPVRHLEQELRPLLTGSQSSKGIVDKVVQVSWRSSGEALLLIHIEIQGQATQDFARRMYRYYYRLVDRSGLPVTSLALLVDATRGFLPTCYIEETPGTRLSFEFSVVKLLEFRTVEELESDPSPFAMASLVQLEKLRIGADASRLFDSKLQLARRLFRGGYEAEEIRSLFRFLDLVIRLPPAMEEEFETELAGEGESVMEFMSNIERRGWEKGMQEGIQAGIEQGIEQGVAQGEAAMLIRLIERRFGPLSPDVRNRVESADAEQLLVWGDRLLTAATLEAVFAQSDTAP